MTSKTDTTIIINNYIDTLTQKNYENVSSNKKDSLLKKRDVGEQYHKMPENYKKSSEYTKNHIPTLTTQKSSEKEALLPAKIGIQQTNKDTPPDSTTSNNYFEAKNILFIGLFFKHHKEIETIFSGQLIKVLLSINFITTIPNASKKPQNVYIKITDLQTNQLIFLTDKKPKDVYTLANGEKINYSLAAKIIFDEDNTAQYKITRTMSWAIKGNTTVQVEVFWKGKKIGESLNEIKNGIPATTW